MIKTLYFSTFLFWLGCAFSNCSQSNIPIPSHLDSVWAWGDSHTTGYGTVTYLQYLEEATQSKFSDQGIPGETSTMIKKRFLADTLRQSFPVIFEMGTNNIGNESMPVIVPDIEQCVKVLKHKRYLVMSVFGRSNSDFWKGTANYAEVDSINNILARKYKERYVDVWGYLKDHAFDPSVPGDVFLHSKGVPGMAYHMVQNVDSLHFNAAGKRLMADKILTQIHLLYN